MSLHKSTPRPILNGFIDNSIPPKVPVAETFAQHIPYCWLWTERGDPDQVYNLSGAALMNAIGDETFNKRGKFFNMQTVIVEKALQKGNAVYIKPLKAADSTRAYVGLGLEIVKGKVPVYKRDTATGALLKDALGAVQYEEDTPGNKKMVDGVKLRWVRISDAAIKANTDLSTFEPYQGTLEGDAGEEAKVYPIIVGEAFLGSYGNNIGIRLTATTEGHANSIDAKVMKGAKSQIYRFGMVERRGESKPAPIPTIGQDLNVNFAFQEGVFDKSTGADYDPKRVWEAYTSNGGIGEQPTIGALSGIYMYAENVKAVGDLIMAAEVASTERTEFHTTNNLTPYTYTDGYEMNIIDGIDMDGIPYFAVNYQERVDAVGGTAAVDGSLLMSSNTNHMLTGGSDGTINFAAYNQLVRDDINSGWINPVAPVSSMAMFPISKVYDSGFELATKLVMPKLLSIRPDISIVLQVGDEEHRRLTVAEENEQARILTSRLALFPESIDAGTGVCRADIFSSWMVLDNYDYKGLVPHTVDHVQKQASWAGSGDGKLRKERFYDYHPGSVLEGVKEVTNTYRAPKLEDASWAANLNYPINIARNTYQVPAFQTAYEESRSVLNSVIIRDINCDLQKVLFRLWVETTGRSDQTNAQLEEYLERRFVELTDGKYADRVDLVPDAIVTEDDDRRGYSYTMRVYVKANVMKTVGQFFIYDERKVQSKGAL